MVFRLVETGKFCFCPHLLPAIFCMTFVKYSNFSASYSLSFQFLLNSWIISLFYVYPKRRPSWPTFVALTLLLSLVQIVITNTSWTHFILFLMHSLILNVCLVFAPQGFPRSFSQCELIILAQGVSVVLSHSVGCFFSIFTHSDQGLCSIHLPTKILQVLYFGTLIILAQPIAFKACVANHTLNVYAAITASCAFTYACLWQMIHTEPLFWLFTFLFESEKRVQLMQVWSICIGVCIIFAALFAHFSSATANTVIRKFYHVAIILVFITGAKHDLNLLHFTSSAALILMVLLEMIRLTRLPPFGTAIENAFRQFRDEKDSGPLTLTHIYLLIGFALPVWLVPKMHSELLIASGLITIGFGDTFASLIGYTIGRNRWPNSKKTYEGTAGALIAQIAGGLLFAYYVHIDLTLGFIIKLILISMAIALIEASTRQIDNLILPLYFHLFWLLLESISL